ncbi:protein SIEVE ELEMENT OCCLUSION B-like [Nymphaea colorata]|nr:protein SIEVE ELEMENT OCCLUSION B-like [Nymphaea colorata]
MHASEKMAEPRTLLSFNSNNPFVASSNDDTVMKNVQDTHKPDGRTFDVKPVIGVTTQLFTDVASRLQPSIPVIDEVDTMNLDALGGLSYITQKIGCEITYKCSGGADQHATTMALLGDILSCYPWEGKVVLVLAAYAIIYGEFWLTEMLYSSDRLAKSVARLKQLQHVDVVKPQFDKLNNLIKEMLELTWCITKFRDLPIDYIPRDSPAMATAQSHVIIAVYWVIMSVVTSVGQIIAMVGKSSKFSTTSGTWELPSLANKMNNIHNHLQKQFDKLFKFAEEKRLAESFGEIEQLFQTVHVDNMKVMRTFFPEELPFHHNESIPRYGNSRNVEMLRGKIVLLLFSDLEITDEDITCLTKAYKTEQPDQEKGKAARYEIVWVPIWDTTIKENKDLSSAKASKMPWLTVVRPPPPQSAFVKYVRKVWRFKKKAILVALDGQGEVINQNALYMMYIWGNAAYPFGRTREEELWREQKWTWDFLAGGLDLPLSPLEDEKHVCLFGGLDMGWIEEFTKKLEEVMRVAETNIQMLYLGVPQPSTPTGTQQIIDTLSKERIGESKVDIGLIGFFWTRLECMLHSLMQIRKKSAVQDKVTLLLTRGSSGRGWALLLKGNGKWFQGDGSALLSQLADFKSWKNEIPTKGFIDAIDASYERYFKQQCLNLLLPGSSPIRQVTCPCCTKNMETLLLFRCCNDRHF